MIRFCWIKLKCPKDAKNKYCRHTGGHIYMQLVHRYKINRKTPLIFKEILVFPNLVGILPFIFHTQ